MVLDAQQVEVLSKKILVIHTSFLGDAILALPFLQELQKKYPDAHVDVITAPRAHDIFRASPVTQKIQILDKRNKHKSLLATCRFGKKLREEGYDAVYSLHRSLRTSLLVWASGIKPAYGFSTAAASWIYSNKITYRADEHEVLRLLNFLGSGQYHESWKILPEINSGQYTEIVASFLKEKGITSGFVAIAPGSVWETKRYPVKHFIAITSQLLKKGVQVVLLGGPDEKGVCQQITNATGALNAAALLPLIAVKELLQQSALLVTNDSALTHMGMAANCKTLTIYCSTVPEFGFYPYNTKSASIGKTDLDCKPCGIHGHRTCPKKHFHCGEQLLPESVLEKIYSMLEKE